jgi:hypothetical protein
MQVLTAMIDFGLDPQQAAEAPRWTSNLSGQYANWPHDGEDAVTIERRFPDTLCAPSWYGAANRSKPSVISKGRAVSRLFAAIRRLALCSRLRPAPRALAW